MLLSLPFAYRAEVLPARCRNTRELIIRDEVLADVREVHGHELEPAIELCATATTPAERIVLSPEGRLMSTARDVRTGEPLIPSQFERANDGRNDGGFTFAPKLFPFEGMRHGAQGGIPSSARYLPGHMANEWWRSARIVICDRNDRSLAATSYLAEAVMVVDGIVHVECREPVWRFVPWPRPGRAVLELVPERLRAHELFRLDRWDDVCDWTRQHGGVAPRSQANARIVSAASLIRDDPFELATAYRNQMLSAWLLHLANPAAQAVDDETYTVIADGLCSGAAASRDEAICLMNAFLHVFRQVVNERAPYHGTGSAGRIPDLMDRWELERRRGIARLDQLPDEELSQEDIDALVGL